MMNGNYYIVFDGDTVIGFNENGWKTKKYSFWYVNDDYTVEWNGTEIFLNSEQVIDLLEYDEDLNSNNVYGITTSDDNYLENLLNMLKSDTSKTMSEFINMGIYSNTELIEKLRNEECGDDLKITEDAVKRPSHYMLEDGTEVKNHIRSILGDDGFKSWAIGNAIKYLSRYKDKGKPVQDLKKAQENIQMVIDVLGEQDGLD